MKPRVGLVVDAGAIRLAAEGENSDYVVGPHLAARVLVLEEEYDRVRGLISRFGEPRPNPLIKIDYTQQVYESFEPSFPKSAIPDGWQVVNGTPRTEAYVVAGHVSVRPGQESNEAADREIDLGTYAEIADDFFETPKDPTRPYEPRCPAGEPWKRVDFHFDHDNNQLVRTWYCNCKHETSTFAECPHTQHKLNSQGRDTCAICDQVLVGFTRVAASEGQARGVPVLEPVKA